MAESRSDSKTSSGRRELADKKTRVAASSLTKHPPSLPQTWRLAAHRPSKVALPPASPAAASPDDYVLPHPSASPRSGPGPHYPPSYAASLPPPSLAPTTPLEAVGATAGALAAALMGAAAAAASVALDVGRARAPSALHAAAAQLAAVAALAPPPAAAAAVVAGGRALVAPSPATNARALSTLTAADSARVTAAVLAAGLAHAPLLVRLALLAFQAAALVWVWLPLTLVAPAAARGASAAIDASLAAALAVAAGRAVEGSDLAPWTDGGRVGVPPAAASYWRPPPGAGVRSGLLLPARADAVARSMVAASGPGPNPVS